MACKRVTDFRSIVEWKFSECTDCTFAPRCPAGMENIQVCFLEDKHIFTDDPFGYLVKWAIRKTLYKRHLGNKHKGPLVQINKGPVKPRYLGATLYCSDMEVFNACRRSG